MGRTTTVECRWDGLRSYRGCVSEWLLSVQDIGPLVGNTDPGLRGEEKEQRKVYGKFTGRDQFDWASVQRFCDDPVRSHANGSTQGGVLARRALGGWPVQGRREDVESRGDGYSRGPSQPLTDDVDPYETCDEVPDGSVG